MSRTVTAHLFSSVTGRRLFDESVPLTRLRLVDSTSTPAGKAILPYALRESD
jgi:RNA polymerase sigma-70 factor (ECF subfamily)